MKTVARHNTLIEAQAQKSLLEGSGIPAFLPDENTVQMNWMYTNAIGGVRVQVNENDYERAMELIHLESEEI
jgi:hypothetical protein